MKLILNYIKNKKRKPETPLAYYFYQRKHGWSATDAYLDTIGLFGRKITVDGIDETEFNKHFWRWKMWLK